MGRGSVSKRKNKEGNRGKLGVKKGKGKKKKKGEEGGDSLGGIVKTEGVKGV